MDSLKEFVDWDALQRTHRVIRHKGESVVYAILAQGEVPLVKFGRTTSIKTRLRSLRTEHPVELEVIGTIVGAHTLEKLIHDALARHRVMGEWFRYEGWAKTTADFIRKGESKRLYSYLDKISALN